MTIKTFSYTRCNNHECNLNFQPVVWLEYRKRGFCSKACEEAAMKSKLDLKKLNEDDINYLIEGYADMVDFSIGGNQIPHEDLLECRGIINGIVGKCLTK